MRQTFPILVLAALLQITSSASACNIPVFRYALERWKSDPVQICVFHSGDLTDADQQKLNAYRNAAAVASGRANAELQIYDIDGKMPEAASLLWAQLSPTSPQLPLVAIQSTVAGRSRSHWNRSLHDTDFSLLLSSPRRSAIADRLLAGHAMVWVMLDGPDEAQNEKVANQLTRQLQKLQSEVALPDGVGLPGSELYADVPLLLKFSVLRIAADEPREAYLRDLMKSVAGTEHGGPLLMPVFGRGRAFSVLTADELTESLTEDVVVFLSGACSCQVKEQNPGFDLLMSTNWDQQLFGDFATALPPLELASAPATGNSPGVPGGEESSAPELVEIAAGKASRNGQAATAQSDGHATGAIRTLQQPAVDANNAGVARASMLKEQSTTLSLLIVLVVGIIVVLSVARRVDL